MLCYGCRAPEQSTESANRKHPPHNATRIPYPDLGRTRCAIIASRATFPSQKLFTSL